MTTFGLPGASESFEFPDADASIPLPNIDVVPPDSQYFKGSPADPEPEEGVDSLYVDSQLDPNGMDPDADYPLIATQPQTQSQPKDLEPRQHLVGILMPATTKCQQFELSKDKEKGIWSIGRHPSNDLVLPGIRLSNHHCRLRWNGLYGTRSQVTLEDSKSRNGTWINDAYVKNGERAILRNGATVSFGRPHPNEFTFIYRDIEGQLSRSANQIWAKYDMGIELGVGAFARVFSAIERATGKDYAVKIIDKSRLHHSHIDNQSAVREVAILKHLAEFRHNNIVSLHEHFEEEHFLYVVMELVKGGDLLTYLTSRGPLPEDTVRHMAAQICHAVAYIHSQGVTHRDLKPENIMLTVKDPPECKVADFGLAKLVDDQTFLKTMCGTPAYLAPEVMLRANVNQAYDNRVDSWSLGIIFYCMLTNHQPFNNAYDPAADATQQRNYFGTRQVDWSLLTHSNLSPHGHDFLRNLLIEDPRDRKHVAYMLDHPWICNLVPPDSQFQNPQALVQSSSTPSTTDGAVACSQSFRELSLSDVAIPGLSIMTQQDHATSGANGTSILPDSAYQGMESVTSEVSVSSKIPGAYPQAKRIRPRQPLATVEETVVENASWNFASPCDGAGPSYRMAQTPVQTPSKRKNDLIEGNSPLTPLTSDDEQIVKELPKKSIGRRGMAPSSKGTPVEHSPNKRKARQPPPSSRPRRAISTRDEDYTSRKGIRRQQPTAKAPRYI